MVDLYNRFGHAQGGGGGEGEGGRGISNKGIPPNIVLEHITHKDHPITRGLTDQLIVVPDQLIVVPHQLIVISNQLNVYLIS